MIRDLPLQRVFAVSAVRAVLVAHDEHVSVGDVPRSEPGAHQPDNVRVAVRTEKRNLKRCRCIHALNQRPQELLLGLLFDEDQQPPNHSG